MDDSSNWFIKSADKWWVALGVYIILIVASFVALLFEWPTAVAIGIYALAGGFFLYSMCIQGIRKRWGTLALGLGFGFLVTIASGLVLLAGAIMDGMNPHPVAVTKVFHSDQFVESTHMAFPSNASFIAQDDTIIVRGGEGEYTATAFVKLEKKDFNKILAQLRADGCNSKLRATLFIGHRYWSLCVVEGIRHRSDFLLGEGPRSFELHPSGFIISCQ